MFDHATGYLNLQKISGTAQPAKIAQKKAFTTTRIMPYFITQSGLPRRNYCLLNSRLESVPVSCRTRILLPRHGPPTGGGRHSPDPAVAP